MGYVLGTGNNFTLVKAVEYVPGEFDMVTFNFDDGVTSLTTTADHVHFVVSDGSWTSVEAGSVTPGSWMQRLSAVASSKVASVARHTSIGKYYISTSSCTAFANDVLTSTTCREPVVTRQTTIEV